MRCLRCSPTIGYFQGTLVSKIVLRSGWHTTWRNTGWHTTLAASSPLATPPRNQLPPARATRRRGLVPASSLAPIRPPQPSDWCYRWVVVTLHFGCGGGGGGVYLWLVGVCPWLVGGVAAAAAARLGLKRGFQVGSLVSAMGFIGWSQVWRTAANGPR